MRLRGTTSAGGDTLGERPGGAVGDATSLRGLAAADQIIGVGQPGRIEMLPIRNGFIVPEPSTVGLLAAGLAVAMAARGSAPTKSIA
jgi:hypothetical protein